MRGVGMVGDSSSVSSSERSTAPRSEGLPRLDPLAGGAAVRPTAAPAACPDVLPRDRVLAVLSRGTCWYSFDVLMLGEL